MKHNKVIEDLMNEHNNAIIDLNDQIKKLKNENLKLMVVDNINIENNKYPKGYYNER